MMTNNKRCFGHSERYADYHDNEWGVPSFDERYLFEMLCLEGAQAGLSFETVLNKREAYRTLFCHFEPERVAQLSDDYLLELVNDKRIIRHQKKIFSVRNNAQVFLRIQKSHHSFSEYLWAYVDGKPIKNHYQSLSELPTQTAISLKLSKDLKKLGMIFIGPTICYAYMQAVGLVNDHITSCHCYQRVPVSYL